MNRITHTPVTIVDAARWPFSIYPKSKDAKECNPPDAADKLRRENGELTNRIKSLEDENNKQREEITNKARKNTALESDLDKFRMEYQRNAQEKQNLEKQVSELIQNETNLLKNLESMEKSYHKMESEMTQLNIVNKTIQDERNVWQEKEAVLVAELKKETQNVQHLKEELKRAMGGAEGHVDQEAENTQPETQDSMAEEQTDPNSATEQSMVEEQTDPHSEMQFLVIQPEIVPVNVKVWLCGHPLVTKDEDSTAVRHDLAPRPLFNAHFPAYCFES
eukprot:3934385-Rhodomonas_salina.2